MNHTTKNSEILHCEVFYNGLGKLLVECFVREIDPTTYIKIAKGKGRGGEILMNNVEFDINSLSIGEVHQGDDDSKVVSYDTNCGGCGRSIDMRIDQD